MRVSKEGEPGRLDDYKDGESDVKQAWAVRHEPIPKGGRGGFVPPVDSHAAMLSHRSNVESSGLKGHYRRTYVASDGSASQAEKKRRESADSFFKRNVS